MDATEVLIVEASYERLKEAVDTIFSTFPLEVKGKKVLLKPNMVGGYPPERRVTTDPGLVRHCVAYLKDAGAQVIVGDNPGVMGYGANEQVAKASGIRQASGDHYRNISREVKKVAFRSQFAAATTVSRAVLEADIFISLPRFKTHMQTLISGAIKNSYGILAGGEKAKFHRLVPRPADFSRLVAEIFAIRPPDLIIMDAIEVMEGNGPSSKDLRPLGKIIASRDGAGVDTVMAAIMGLKVEDVPMLQAAADLKLGKTDLNKLEIKGEWSPLPNFKIPISFGRGGRLGKLINRLWGNLFYRPTPRINSATCRRCGVCFQQCPAKAIDKSESGFRIDPGRCIRCYCCYELCIYGAIKTGSSLERFLKTILRMREGI
jgi:uncharacterized protein (DUF362 family)/Pyruvate/2-oxoacid:ferredoxin oxidoreductase delta subunit